MTAPPSCPRCSSSLHGPGLMASTWDCPRHGPVTPYHRTPHVSASVVLQEGARSDVPLWSPLPLLPGWTLTGFGAAGDPRSPLSATALAFSGPSPLGGPADLVLVAEEPGVGLGAHVAGLDGLDPGQSAVGQPDAKVEVGGHPTALWCCDSADDRVAFVGEARGVWLWAVLWPPTAELVLLEHLVLHDLRDEAQAAQTLPVGARSAVLP